MARVRLVDVAERAQVSMKTVSNVVNGYAHVQPELRARVQAAIDELGYRPNLTARRLASGRTGMIALAMPEIDHPYFAEVASHLGDVARERGYRVIIEQTLSEANAERAVLQDPEEGLVDGVIFQPARMATLDIERLHHDSPLVLLGEIDAPDTIDHVMIDNVAGAAEGVAHLVALGRRRIAFLGLVEGDITTTNQRRLVGYRMALADAGLPEHPELVLTTGGFDVDHVTEAVDRALASGTRIDGILARDDRFAVGALIALRRRGISVPDEVAVVGWDDSAIARYTNPSLTSIAPDKHALATEAFDLLYERMQGYTGPGRHRIVPHRLAVRESAPDHPETTDAADSARRGELDVAGR